MVSITLAVPEEVREAMRKHDDINWSGFIRKAIMEKTKSLSEREQMLSRLKVDNEIADWAVSLLRKSRETRLKELRRKRSF